MMMDHTTEHRQSSIISNDDGAVVILFMAMKVEPLTTTKMGWAIPKNSREEISTAATRHDMGWVGTPPHAHNVVHAAVTMMMMLMRTGTATATRMRVP